MAGRYPLELAIIFHIGYRFTPLQAGGNCNGANELNTIVDRPHYNSFKWGRLKRPRLTDT
jgi:hypothetical protein